MNNVISSQFLNNTWLGELELRFSVQKGKSVLTKCRHSGPFVVQRSFYSEEDKITPHVYLLHLSGGLVGGDQLILDVQLETNSRALLTTSSASKFYRTNGLYASQKNVFKLANNAILEWVPQNIIFFPKSKAKINTTFILENGARIIAFEILCFKSVILNLDFSPEEINVFLNINLSNSVGLKERLQMNKLEDYIIKLGGFKMSALFFAAPSNEKMLRQIRKLLGRELVDNNSQIGGVTLLDELLIVRLLGNDNQSLKKMLYCIWSIVRPIIIGKNIVIPRIWST